MNSVIEGNSALEGGGLYNDQFVGYDGTQYIGIITVIDSTIEGNHAESGGGIYNVSQLTLSGSTLVGNKLTVGGAGRGAGLVNLDKGTATVANSTITGNIGSGMQGSGSGIHNNGSISIYNSTFSGNHGAHTIFNFGSNAHLSLINTIVVDPGKRDVTEYWWGCANEYDGEIVDYKNNLVVSHINDPTNPALCGETQPIDADLKLGSLQDNGGPTLTMALLEGSAAIDAGHAATCAGELVGGVDQRGALRPFGDACDIGAYEYGGLFPTPPLVVNLAGDAGNGTCDETQCTLRDAVLTAESGDTITFDESLSNQTITLTQGHIHIGKSLTIEGPGAHLLAISGGENEPNYDDYYASIGGVFKVYGFYGDGGVEEIEVNISGLTIRDGRAREGGGVYNHSRSTLIMTDCVIGPNNVVTESGGGLSNRYGDVILNRCTVEGNHGTGSIGGAGISGAEGSTTLINTTVSGNVTNNHGGGIFVGYNSILNLIHTTITKNIANQDYEVYPWGGAGGIYVEGGVVNIHNSIVAGNTDMSDLDTAGHDKWHDVYGDFTSLGGNLIGDGADSTGWIGDDQVGTAAEPIDAKLGSLALNSPGTTPTHALLLGSPAINAVECLEDVTIDQRGVDRPQGDLCDIGAYELESAMIYSAAFSGTPTSGTAPLTVNFSNTSIGSYTTCAWTFGDDGTSTNCSDPSHTYESAGTYTVSLMISGPSGEDTETKTDYIQVFGDFTPPELYITGAMAQKGDETPSPMPGNPEYGFILETGNDPDVDHLIQFKDGTAASKPLEADYFGLYLVESTVSDEDLKAYYNTRPGLPPAFLEYLLGAVDKDNPFVLIKGDGTTAVSLVDAAKYTISEGTVVDDMTVPDDFPLGKYTVRGEIEDLAGNKTEITLTLIVVGDREGRSELTTARTKCAVYAAGDASSLPSLSYSIRTDKRTGEAMIHKVTPATFLYYVSAFLPADPSNLVIRQENLAGFPAMGASVTLFDANCAKLSPQAATVSIVDGNITIDFAAGEAGRIVYVAVSYTARTLRGQVVPPLTEDGTIVGYPDIDYIFSAALDDKLITSSNLYLVHTAN